MGFSLAELLSAFRDLICPVPYQQGLQTLGTMWGWLFSEQRQKLVHFKQAIATMPPAPLSQCATQIMLRKKQLGRNWGSRGRAKTSYLKLNSLAGL